MASTQEYTDIKIVECNRLHSEEAKAKNNENYSLWTNNLQDILHLNPQDQVSVQGAFISERGAGQSTSIEIKGVELGQKHEYTYMNLSKTLVGGDRLDDNLPSRCSKCEAIYTVENYPIRDDTLRFTMNYYMVANALNCMHLPRRWMYNAPTPRENYTITDNRSAQGATLTRYLVSNAASGTKVYAQTEAFYDCLEGTGGEILQKPKNDNSRYTIMVRDNTYFTQAAVDESFFSLPANDLRDPENATYHTFGDLKTLQVPAGFNSAEFIATEITRQLNAVTNDETLIQRNNADESYPIFVSKLLESETYKAFYTANWSDNSLANFLKLFNLSGASNTTADKSYRPGHELDQGFEWLRQYQFVGCKYPELYETGRLLNRDFNQAYKGILGGQIYQNYVGGDGPFILDIPYTKDRVDEFKAFFDAQKLYPEIIDNLNSENASGYRGTDNSIDNTRWVHINRKNASTQSLANPPTLDTTQLGWGGYYYPRSYNPTVTSIQLCSFLLPLYFDPNQSETFYENPDSDKRGEYTYGCLGKVDGRIAIYPTRHVNNGWAGNQDLFTKELFENSVIEQYRKIGFDLHFNAPGMYYMIPMNGWIQYTDGQSSSAIHGGWWEVPNASQDNKPVSTVPLANLTDLNPWKKLLYLGADNPKLNWDGTNFSWSDFHTAMNRGNDYQAGNPAFPTVTPEDRASDIVYKINPPNHAYDWTPDRTPYVFDAYNLSQRMTTPSTNIRVPRINHNFEKWRIYDMLSGIYVQDFGVPEELWSDSLWGLLGFTYQQFHSTTNNRLTRIQSGNANDLSLLTTNAEVVEGDTKIFSTNWAGTQMYNGMITTPANIFGWDSTGANIVHLTSVYPQIIHTTESIKIIADNLPTRMIRGYYTIRSNILEGTPFIGGKVNNTTMPIIGIVDKINGDGDFYFGQESSLSFTITKPLRIASVAISIHDPDGSYARTSEQSTVLFKITKPKQVVFNVLDQILQMSQSKQPPAVQRL